MSVESVGLDNAVLQVQRQFDSQASNERNAGVIAGFDAVAFGYLLKAGLPQSGTYLVMEGVLVLGLALSALQAARVLRGTTLFTGPISPAGFSAQLKGATVADAQTQMLQILDEVIQRNDSVLQERAKQGRGALLWIVAGLTWAAIALLTQTSRQLLGL